MGGRWPGWVYDDGDEPDYRFSFANERTFLAWIRTALALIAAGVAADVVDLRVPSPAHRIIVVVLLGAGLLCAVTGWIRWARSERALRRGEPLPGAGVAVVLAVAVAIVAVALVVVL